MDERAVDEIRQGQVPGLTRDPMKTASFPYQREIFEASKDMEAAALLMDMGTGKTKVLVDTICHLWMALKINCVLVVCPKGVLPAWQRELDIHTWDSVRMRVVTCRAESLMQSKGAEQAALSGSTRDPMAINYKRPLRVALFPVSLLSTTKGVEYSHRFLASGPSMMILDESTSIKNPKARRTQAVLGWTKHRGRAAFAGLADFADYRRIATGMPVTQSPLDLWAQFEFLRKGGLGFGSYFSFRAQFANIIPKRFGSRVYPKIVGYRSLDLLQKRIVPLSFRVTKQEALPYLPAKLYTTYAVDLTEEQKRMYHEMRKHAIAKWGNGEEVSAPVVVTQILRMQEILCGYTRSDEGKRLPVESNRLSALMELLEGVSGKVIIWAPFTWSIGEIVAALNEAYGEGSVVPYYGITSTHQRVEAIDKFQNGLGCRFFVSNAKTGGAGLTLTAATTVIYYANSHSVEARTQSEDRAHRAGQHNAVTYIDMIAPGTVDEKLLAALRTKRSLADMIVNGGIEDII